MAKACDYLAKYVLMGGPVLQPPWVEVALPPAKQVTTPPVIVGDFSDLVFEAQSCERRMKPSHYNSLPCGWEGCGEDHLGGGEEAGSLGVQECEKRAGCAGLVIFRLTTMQ